MAKNLINSISFTVLLLVLVMASTGFLKSEALPGVDCLNTGSTTCPLNSQRTFLDECGEVPFLRTDLDCCNCCKGLYPTSPPPLCWAVVEGTNPPHCHCYRKV